MGPTYCLLIYTSTDVDSDTEKLNFVDQWMEPKRVTKFDLKEVLGVEKFFFYG